MRRGAISPSWMACQNTVPWAKTRPKLSSPVPRCASIWSDPAVPRCVYFSGRNRASAMLSSPPKATRWARPAACSSISARLFFHIAERDFKFAKIGKIKRCGRCAGDRVPLIGQHSGSGADGAGAITWAGAVGGADIKRQAGHAKGEAPVMRRAPRKACGAAKEMGAHLGVVCNPPAPPVQGVGCRVTQIRFVAGRSAKSSPVVPQPIQPWRSTISFLISPMASAGLSPLGQVRVQFMMVWHRYSRKGSSRLSNRSPVASSRESAIQR